MRTAAISLSLALALASFAACSGKSNSGSGFGSSSGGGSGGSGSSGGGGDDTSSGSSGGSSGGSLGSSSGSGSSSGGGGCNPDPGSYDIPNNGCDDDGNGKVDDVPTCDTGVSNDAMGFAKAIGLCQQADATHWGVVSATFTNGHASTQAGGGNFDQQHGVLPKFGSVIKPREGSMLAVLSSGSATEEDTDQGPGGGSAGMFKGTKNGMQGGIGSIGNPGDVPNGYPKTSQGCPSLSSTVMDVIAVHLQVKVPNNAKGLGFDFDFWSGEWPDYECSAYNDAFIAFLTSKAFNNGTPDNISFDGNGNSISVNNNFFAVCTPNVQTGCSGTKGTSKCSLGEGELAGTGFGDPKDTYCKDTSTSGGATSWLTSQAPVQGGETITLEFIIWDTGDWQYDSSVLVDNFQWVPNPIQGPVTTPSPPK